jgi:hypothetical protein
MVMRVLGFAKYATDSEMLHATEIYRQNCYQNELIQAKKRKLQSKKAKLETTKIELASEKLELESENNKIMRKRLEIEYAKYVNQADLGSDTSHLFFQQDYE